MSNARTRKSATPDVKAPVSLAEITDDAARIAQAESVFTREATLAASESVEAATAYASEVLAVAQSGEREGVRLGQRMSVYAAMAAYAAVKSGLLTDGPKPANAAEGVMSPKEWGEAWITDAKPEGVTRQMVDTWIRAGEAFMDWKVDPESPEGKRLLGGLAQSKEWNEARKVLRTAIAEIEEAGEVSDEAKADIATKRIAEVRAEAEAAVAKRKADREAEAKKEAERVKAALAEKNADGKAGNLPDSLPERVVIAEQVIARMRPAVKAEREALEHLAAMIAAALDQHAADVA